MSKLVLKKKVLATAKRKLEEATEAVKREYVVAIMEELPKEGHGKAEDLIEEFILEFGDEYKPVLRQLESIYGVDRIG